MHKCSLAVANGSLLEDPLMMCSWVSNEAFLCGPRPTCFFCSVSKNFGKTPETPLFACSRTSCKNGSSELSPCSNAFLLQDLQKVALRKVHLEDGVKLVVPP